LKVTNVLNCVVVTAR